MRTKENNLSEEDTIRCNRLVKNIQWYAAVCVLVIEVAGNYLLYRKGSLNYDPEHIHYMLFRYLLLTSFINFGALALSRALIRLFHVGIYRQKYILMGALLLILMDVTYSHYQFFSVFAAFTLPTIISALFEDEKFQTGVSVAGVLAITPGMVAKLMDPLYSWGVLPEIVICYMSMICLGFLGGYIARYLASRSAKLTAALHEAEKANRTKSEFLANMSHEIRTPMNAIVGMCELILREDISEEAREYCYNIQDSGHSLLSIINDILDFSKIESGKMELIAEEFDLTSTLNDVINMAETRRESKNIEIIVHADPAIPAGLIGDELRIRQVMINLVSNAVKYTREGCVVLRVAQQALEEGQILLKVSVADTGIGIKKEDIARLFSSFQQVDTHKNRAVEGTGLGLAIARQLVTQMNGEISVSSEYGVGSEFCFTIPLKVSDARPFISIRDAEKYHTAGYIDFGQFTVPRVAEEYRILVNEFTRDFHSDLKLFPTMDELKREVEKGGFTHLFTARKEYLSEKAFFDKAAEHCEVVVAQNHDNAIELPANIQCLFKPFYLLSVAAAFNHEHILTNSKGRKEFAVRFTAPEAHVLVVDDNAVNLEVAVGLMRPYQMQIETAGSAKEALYMLRAKDFDLVFMDHMMPEIDGVQATAMIRAMEGEYYRTLPIIALTANAVNGVRETFLQAGMNDFVAKPIEIFALDRVLRSWLPREKLQMPVERAAEVHNVFANVVERKEKLLDTALGISSVGGDEAVYRKILKIYVDKAQEKADYLNRLFAEQNWDNYVIEVHALKSSSLSIGAKKLSESAKELELAGKAGGYGVIMEKHSALIGLYRKVMDKGKEYLGLFGVKEDKIPQPAADTVELSPEEAMGRLQKIAASCRDFDMDEIIKGCDAVRHGVCRGAALSEAVAGIREAAEDFAYDKALRLTEELIQKLEEIGTGSNDS